MSAVLSCVTLLKSCRGRVRKMATIYDVAAYAGVSPKDGQPGN